MEIQRTASIDELFQHVKDYELVLTVDAALADALNARLPKARLQPFAITPKRFVSQQYPAEDLLEERELFLQIIQETELSWKEAATYLADILQCWQETGHLNAITEYEQYDIPAVHTILAVLEHSATIYGHMEHFTWTTVLSIAVINESQFTGLDRQVLPAEYDTIAIHTEDTIALPPFKVFASATDLVAAIVQNITANTADDIAIVVDEQSDYNTLIKSALQYHGIRFYYSQDMTEQHAVRAFLSLMRLALDRDHLLVEHIQPHAQQLGLELPVTEEQKYLKSVAQTNTTAQDCVALLQQLATGTVVESLELYSRQYNADLSLLEQELQQIGLADSTVSHTALNQLDYYLQSFSLPVETGNTGVLIASPHTSLYIDRPIVLYVGMDASWTRDIPEKPWSDAQKHIRKQMQQFTALIQNGEQQHFLVQDTAQNEEVTPCLYFNEILPDPIESFTDPHIQFTRYGSQQTAAADAFAKHNYDVAFAEWEEISQSALNTFVQCPRQVYFDRLVSSADTTPLTKGSVFHEFAELYYNHPSFVKEQLSDIVDMLFSRLQPFLDSEKQAIERTELHIGCQQIMQYIDTLPAAEHPVPAGYERTPSENGVAQQLNKEITSQRTEMWFSNADLGVRGKVDLLQDQDTLIDFKTGAKPSLFSLIRHSHVDLFKDTPNFQAILYLYHHRTVVPDTPLHFTFFHLLDQSQQYLQGDSNVTEAAVTIPYYPWSFHHHLQRQELFDALREATSRRKLLDALGAENFASIMASLQIDRESLYDKKQLVEEYLEPFRNKCATYVSIGRGQDITEKQLHKQATAVLKQLVTHRLSAYFKEDVDAFADFLQEQLARMNQCLYSRFPLDDADLTSRYMNHKDLILPGDHHC